MFKRVTEWIRRQPRARSFEAFQVEVTSRCVTRCIMCPRVALADQWPDMDLPWEAFQRIARGFALTRHVHLQGWGEPLLHPRFFDMVALAKDAGCRVSLTTNGMRLDQDAAGRLLDLHVDLIAISIAGATSRTHESIRVGADYSLILENVRRLLALRRGRESGRPKVEFSYLMTKANLAELPQAVDLAASLGVDELYATNLDCVITAEQDALKTFACPPPLGQAFGRIVDEARGRARRAGLTFRPYPLDPEELAVCEANPTEILFISCDGWVSPCPYMGLAGRGDIPRRFNGRSLHVLRCRFGNIMDRELIEIWKSPAYRAFRRKFKVRITEATALAIGAGTGNGDAGQPGPSPPPKPCLTCYKLYGV